MMYFDEKTLQTVLSLYYNRTFDVFFILGDKRTAYFNIDMRLSERFKQHKKAHMKITIQLLEQVFNASNIGVLLADQISEEFSFDCIKIRRVYKAKQVIAVYRNVNDTFMRTHQWTI